jgi:hypothetical protein
MLPIIRRSFPFTVVNSRCSLRCTHASLAWFTPYVHSNIPFYSRYASLVCSSCHDTLPPAYFLLFTLPSRIDSLLHCASPAYFATYASPAYFATHASLACFLPHCASLAYAVCNIMITLPPRFFMMHYASLAYPRPRYTSLV